LTSHGIRLEEYFLTPKRFQSDDGVYFPFTILDERGGRETGRGMYEMVDEGKRCKRLPATVFATVKAKASEGERLFNSTEYAHAFKAFHAALDELPEPRQQWNAAGWLLVAMGECSYQMQKWKSALAPFQDAIICPGCLGNPWLHLRLGQVRLELGEERRAADELARAYMGGGREVFEGEDPKYFALVESVLRPPDGMDRLL
jgi:tetratricopeptide (TPR) repeat protein